MISIIRVVQCFVSNSLKIQSIDLYVFGTCQVKPGLCNRDEIIILLHILVDYFIIKYKLWNQNWLLHCIVIVHLIANTNSELYREKHVNNLNY